jgi:hypothetical protein
VADDSFERQLSQQLHFLAQQHHELASRVHDLELLCAQLKGEIAEIKFPVEDTVVNGPLVVCSRCGKPLRKDDTCHRVAKLLLCEACYVEVIDGK